MKRLMLAATGVILFSTTAMAQVQSQQQGGGLLEQLLGSVFGSNQQVSEEALETDWNQGRRPFEQRRTALEARIDTAVRNGSLSRGEADEIRREYADIVRREQQYSANGNVSQEQRRELRTRYRALTQRIGGSGSGTGMGDGQDAGRWLPMASRTNEFERRISEGLRARTLTQTEATRLRADWRSLAQVEASYQRGGIDAREEADLWSRYNAIDRRFGGDANSGGGFGDDHNTARWSQLETRLATAEQSGRISRTEAVHVRAQLSDLARLDASYASSGYNADERAYLAQRYGQLEQALGSSRR
jgi:hypothetical protein